MMEKLLRTDSDIATLPLRLTLGVVMFPHRAGKVFGCFGGYGFAGTMKFFTETAGIPAIFAFLAIAAEFLGSLGLITGLLTRIAAFGIGCNMTVAALMVRLPYGFFMNWFGNQKGEGFEYHLLAMALAAALIIGGAGALSIDGAVAKRLGD